MRWSWRVWHRAQDEPLTKVPKEVKHAEAALTKWLDGFEDLTRDEVASRLGKPAEETTWMFEDKKEPLLIYRVGKTTKLSIYLSRNRVAQAALHFLP